MTDINHIITNISNLNNVNTCYHWNIPTDIRNDEFINNINIITNLMSNIYNNDWSFCSNYSGIHIHLNNRISCILHGINEINNLHEECTVCYNNILLHNRRTLICGHTFHSNCLSIWFQTCRNSNLPLTCPICRYFL